MDKIINVPYLDQSNAAPTGCESVTAVMLLQYLGVDIGINEFIDKYLDKAPFEQRSGELYGPDPRECFAGDPYDPEAMGCYAPVIKKALERVIGEKYEVIDETGREIDELVASGVEIFSDDGNCLMDLTVLYKILMKTKEHNMIIMLHEEDEHMKWFEPTAFLHSAESSIVARDLELIRDVGGRRIHFQHISTRRSVELIRQAKADGLSVSSEVCPHHLLLTKAARDIYGTNAKMAPCLQTQDDIEALIEGLEDGTVDIIVSDHAPHTPEDKATELVKAPNGVIGVEVMFPVLLNEFVHKRKFSYSWLLEKLTIKPARLLGLSGGTLNVGEPADVCIFSDREWVIKAENFASISRNTPYDGWEVKGCVEMTLVDGKVVYSSGIIENR